MNLSEVSEHTQKVLKKNGWYEGREYDITDWVSDLEEEGYELNEYAKSILIELGNISVWERHTEMYNGATFDFDALFAGTGQYDRLEEFEQASGDKLFPIGSVQEYIVYAGESKRIYIGDWASLSLIGNSIEEYLENVFKIKYEPTEIPLNRQD